MTGAQVVARARGCVGRPFRPQGRGADGLDCIGLAATACGVEACAADYRLRSGDAARLEAGLRAAGLEPVADVEAGCILVMRPGPGQLHLGIWSGAGLIHADAALRCVVERPGVVPWPVLSIWTYET